MKDFNELEFLQWFFEAAGRVFGPADGDVYRALIEEYEEETDTDVPDVYAWWKEDYDE